MSPDPSGMAAVDFTNPQSLNMYAYVGNYPVGSIDPSGLWCSGDAGEKDTPCNPSNDPEGGGSSISGIVFWTTTYFADTGDSGLTGNLWAAQFLPGAFFDAGTSGTRSCLAGAGPLASGQSRCALNNGRNCSTGPASAGQYAAATAQVAGMTAGFFSGLGPDSYTFGPDSATSLVMAQSGPVQSVLDQYYMTGQTSGLYTFGAPGYVSAGGNPVAQFVGSFRWSISGGVLSLTNTTSFRSLTYDKGPQWQRFPIVTQYGLFTSPMGNTHQTYNISVTCH